MASGLIPSLRSKFPEAKIMWLAEPVGASLLKETKALDDVIVLPRQKLGQLWSEKKYRQWWQLFSAFRKTLKEKNIDWALDTQGLLKSAVWAKISGAKYRIGLGSKEGSQLFMHEVLNRPADDPQISSEYRLLMSHLDLPLERANLGVLSETSQKVKTLLAEKGISDRYFVLCPFTTRPQKHWLADRWPVLADKLFQEYGIKSVILGGPADRQNAENMVAQSENLISVAGVTNLIESTAIIYQASALIGVDTGMTHIAHIKQQPAICLFGSTRPYLDADNPNAKVIYHDYSCSPCRRNPTCDGRFDCMSSISIDEVLNELRAKIHVNIPAKVVE